MLFGEPVLLLAYFFPFVWSPQSCENGGCVSDPPCSRRRSSFGSDWPGRSFSSDSPFKKPGMETTSHSDITKLTVSAWDRTRLGLRLQRKEPPSMQAAQMLVCWWRHWHAIAQCEPAMTAGGIQGKSEFLGLSFDHTNCETFSLVQASSTHIHSLQRYRPPKHTTIRNPSTTLGHHRPKKLASAPPTSMQLLALLRSLLVLLAVCLVAGHAKRIPPIKSPRPTKIRPTKPITIHQTSVVTVVLPKPTTGSEIESKLPCSRTFVPLPTLTAPSSLTLPQVPPNPVAPSGPGRATSG